MMKKTLVAIALSGVSFMAVAAPLFSQTPTVNTGTRSDPSSPPILADDFNLSGSATIRSVSWKGMYFPSGSPQATDDFTINFYTDAGGTVGGLLNSFHVGNAVNRTNTGQQFSPGVFFYSYSADLGTGIGLGASTYWMSVFDNTSADTNDDWYWAVNTGIPGNDRFSFDSGSTWSASGFTTYFVIDNSNLASGVPEPAPAFLLAFGLVAFILRRRFPPI